MLSQKYSYTFFYVNDEINRFDFYIISTKSERHKFRFLLLNLKQEIYTISTQQNKIQLKTQFNYHHKTKINQNYCGLFIYSGHLCHTKHSSWYLFS